MPEMIVRLKRGKETFEVLTFEGAVTKYRQNDMKKLEDVLASGDVIFTDVKKGKQASKEQLAVAFGDVERHAMLEMLVKKGEVQVSAGERKDKLEAKRAEIVAHIHKTFVDPARGGPVPVTRIDNALNQLKPRIDPDVAADRQVGAMLPKLTQILPLRKGGAVVTGTIKVPSKWIGSAGSVVRKHGTVTEEEFGADGAKWTVEIHSMDALLRDIARATKGEYQFFADGDSTASSGTGPSSDRGASSGSSGKKKKKGKK